MHCRSCNTRLAPSDRTCPNCGITINRSATRSRKAERERKPSLSPSTAIDPMDSLEEVELDQVSQVEPSVEPAAPRAQRPRRAARKPRATGGGFRPEPADVRRMIGERPELLESGLRPYTDDKGAKRGAAFSTDVGEIDLLALDEAGGMVVVMVAEPGEEKDLVSDVLQRVGWVGKHLAQRGQEVRGVVLVEPHVQDLSYAAAAVAGTIDFKSYRISLCFDDVEV